MSKLMIEALDRRLLMYSMGPAKNTNPTSTNSGSSSPWVAGVVNFNDLVTLAQNYNGNSTAWLAGDYTSEGSIDFSDLVSLAQNYNGSVTGLSGSSSFTSDWTLAQSLVGGDSSPATPPVASVGKNGKLTVTLVYGDFADIHLTKGGRTAVQVGQHDTALVGKPLISFDQSFSGVKSIEVVGSSRDDQILLGNDLRTTVVHAGAGKDSIHGGNGAEMLFGGEGNDQIDGGGGNDSIYGESGDDRLFGSTGNDMLEGGAGKDRLEGGKGKNKLAGGAGLDYVTVRAGMDKIERDAKDKLTELA